MIEIINVLHLIFIDQIFWTVMIMLSFLILMGYFLFLWVGSFKGTEFNLDLYKLAIMTLFEFVSSRCLSFTLKIAA